MTAVGLLATGCIFALMYPLAETRVEVVRDRLVLRWRVLRYLPFGRRKIPLGRIIDVRPYTRRDWKLPVQFFGGALRPGRAHVAIVVRSHLFGIAYGLVVAPTDADGLIRALRSAIRT